MKYLSFLLLLAGCAGQPNRNPYPATAPVQFVLPVKPGDAVIIRSPAPAPLPSAGATSSTGASQTAEGGSIRTRAAAPASQGYDATLAGYAYPFDVKYVEFRSQDEPLRMAYMDAFPGRASAGTVLLFHGSNFTSAYWRQTIQALTARGFRVIAPDQVGFGKSTKPVRYQFSFDALCDNTKRLLQSLGVNRVSVIGHSMGGMLAARCAIQDPGLIDKVILVNPLGLENYALTVPYQPIERTYHLELTQTEDALRAYMRASYFGGLWSPQYDELIEPLVGWMNGPDRARIAWDRALVADMIYTQPVLQDFPHLAQPTLLVIGQRDRTAIGKDRVSAVEAARLGDYSSLGRRAARLIPHSKLVELSSAGHLPQVDDFDGYIRAVEEFLGR